MNDHHTIGRTASILAALAVMTAASAALFAVMPSREGPATLRTGAHPAKIISLSPSVTRMIVDLGAGGSVVGVTTYDHPPGPHTRFVGTYIAPDAERILGLRPDVIILSRYDESVQDTARLGLAGIPVHAFPRVRTRADIETGYRELASLLGRSHAADEKLREYGRIARSAHRPAGRPRIAVFIAHEPLVAAGGASFIDGIIREAGCENACVALDRPYPIISREYLMGMRPDVIISIVEGAPDFFNGLLAGMPPGAVKNNCIYSIDPDLICFYTPGDYARAVNEIAKLCSGACTHETR
jgi:iron complex transport system substrate-binding protein